jgi:hypothetical protein
MKFLVYVLFAAIIVSLATGLFYLRGEHADSKKMLRALKFRVGLSLVLILVLVGAYLFGWINPPAR